MTLPQPETTTWAEYMIVCADGAGRHQAPSKGNRLLAIQAAAGWDRPRRGILCEDEPTTCGPHRVLQRTLTATDWEPLRDGPSPQEAQADGYRAAAETKPCRKCGAAAGAGCEDLTARRKGLLVLTRWPHRVRIEDATS